MMRSDVRRSLLCSLIVVLIFGVLFPAHAQYTKYYQFTNATGVSQTWARAVTMGLESISSTYSSPWGTATAGFTFLGGAWNSTITTPTGTVLNGGTAQLAWRTADASCYLRDLRWGGGTPIIPTLLSGVPGGGGVAQTGANTYEWTICNTLDPVAPNDPSQGPIIQLANVQYSPFVGAPLDFADLGEVAALGIAGKLVLDIDLATLELKLDIWEAEADGKIPDPSANSLVGKITNAEEDKDAGLVAFEAGNLAKASFYWNRAIKHMQTFKSELITTAGRKGLDPAMVQDWLNAADSIIAQLQALASVQALSVTGVAPATLLPGECFSFTASGVGPGDALVLSGYVLGDDGQPVVNWTEQAALSGLGDRTPPIIISADISPAFLWPPDHSLVTMTLNVEVADDNPLGEPAPWFIESVTSNQPSEGTGDGDASPDWIIGGDGQTLQLRQERAGNTQETRLYSVTLRARDAAGNESEPVTLIVPVNHDESW